MARVEVDGKTYGFDPERFLNVELMAIERVTGMTSLAWQNALNEGSMLAATALVWILQKRHDDPALQFDDVVFESSSLSLHADAESPKDSSPTTPEPGSSPSPMSSDSSTGGDSAPGNLTS